MGSSQSSHETAGSDNDRASAGSSTATGEESSTNTAAAPSRGRGEEPSFVPPGAPLPQTHTQTSPAPNHQKPPAHPSPSLSGMPLVHHVCRKKKRLYDNCVAKHYQNFVLGNAAALVEGDGGREPSLKQEDACGDRFEAYRECILKGIKKEIWDKQGLPPPGEGSPLMDVADD